MYGNYAFVCMLQHAIIVQISRGNCFTLMERSGAAACFICLIILILQ
jgi:hypothetical protein